jgi:hypothetical protein
MWGRQEWAVGVFHYWVAEEMEHCGRLGQDPRAGVGSKRAL